jgi:hypothetical protein
LIGVRRRGAALSRSGIIGESGRARAVIDRCNTTGARQAGARQRRQKVVRLSYADRSADLSHLSGT